DLTENRSPTHGKGSSFRAGRSQFENGLRSSRLQSAANGTFYFLQNINPPSIAVVSPSGAMKTIPLPPPKGTTLASTLVVGEDRLVVEYLKYKEGSESGELDSVLLQIISASRGRPVMTLRHSDPEIGPSLACYDGDETLIFVNTDDNSYLELVKVRP